MNAASSWIVPLLILGVPALRLRGQADPRLRELHRGREGGVRDRRPHHARTWSRSWWPSGCSGRAARWTGWSGSSSRSSSWAGFPAEALPSSLMRSLSGSAAFAMSSEIFKIHGPDSFIGRLVSVIQGSTETTFYIMAVYFGAHRGAQDAVHAGGQPDHGPVGDRRGVHHLQAVVLTMDQDQCGFKVECVDDEPRSIRPAARPGDRVALISPASPPDGPDAAAAREDAPGAARARGGGRQARHGRVRLPRRLRPRAPAGPRGGVPRSRASRRSSARAAATASARLLAGFDPALAARHPKALVGFSDITVLHLALQKAGVVSFWGPMPCTGLGWTPFSVRGLERALMSAEPAGPRPVLAGAGVRRRCGAGIAEGPLTGGTLSLMAASLGTPYEIETRGRIVFMEDVDEEPYRVDRMLAQLIAAGKLAGRRRRRARASSPAPTCGTRPGKRSLTMTAGVRRSPAAVEGAGAGQPRGGTRARPGDAALRREGADGCGSQEGGGAGAGGGAALREGWRSGENWPRRIQSRSIFMRRLECLAFLLVMLAGRAVPAEPAPEFRAGKPVWPKGRATEMNLLVGFRAVVAAPPAGAKVVLRVAASTIYRACVNGAVRRPRAGARAARLLPRRRVGPDRRARGRARTWSAIEVAGYNVNSYYLLDQPSFLQAEVVAGDRVLAATAGQGAPFAAAVLDHRVQKVQRYSFQRPFIEVYRLAPGCDRWRRDAGGAIRRRSRLQVQPSQALLPRRVPLPDFARHAPGRGTWPRAGSRGGRGRATLWKDRSLVEHRPEAQGLTRRASWRSSPSTEMQHLASTQTAALDRPWSAGDDGRARGRRLPRSSIWAQPDRLPRADRRRAARRRGCAWSFDEILTGGDVDFKRLGCVNVVSYELEPGTTALESIEPYTLPLPEADLPGGRVSRSADVYLREYAHPGDHGQPASPPATSGSTGCSRPACETFRQNALDIFMDCPSRERAGWLCDSFFTARVAADLTGRHAGRGRTSSRTSCCPERFAHLPDGMLPDVLSGRSLRRRLHPQLGDVVRRASWRSTLARGGDRAMVDGLRPQGAAAARLLPAVRERRRPAGEAARAGCSSSGRRPTTSCRT